MNNTSATRLEAVLLLGPTGSGKTPLGHWLEQHGLWQQKCHHFDFGESLRAIATAGPSHDFNLQEIQFLKEVLEKGALLENETFYLAERILEQFIVRRNVQSDDLLIMNGLPRHIDQASAIDTRLQMIAVIQLECDAPTVFQRLRLDSGGDRRAREDDHEALVVRKLAIFAERTQPLIAHYQNLGARVIHLPVDVNTQPAQHWRSLHHQ